MENTLVQSEERTWSMLAHLSALLNLFMPALGGVIGAGVIYLVYKDKSGRSLSMPCSRWFCRD